MPCSALNDLVQECASTCALRIWLCGLLFRSACWATFLVPGIRIMGWVTHVGVGEIPDTVSPEVWSFEQNGWFVSLWFPFQTPKWLP